MNKIAWIIISSVVALVLVLGLLAEVVLPRMWDYLVVNQPPRPADVIIVLTGDMSRVDAGVTLYQEGYADKMLFTGGSAAYMASRAESLGVPAAAILLEERSRTTFQNAEFSYKIVEAQGFTSAIVVTSAYHTRRSGLIFRRCFQGVDVTVCSAPYDPALSHTWWRHSDTGEEVVSEYLKLGFYYTFERWLIKV